MNRLCTRALLVAGAIVCSHTLPAEAVAASIWRATAVDRCQSALPTFDGNIRKRPKAVQNEGSASAFITCGFSSNNHQISYALLGLINSGGTGAIVRCTLVPGQYAEATALVPREVALAPGATGLLNWHYETYGGRFGVDPAVSCSLPPGVGITDVYSHVDD